MSDRLAWDGAAVSAPLIKSASTNPNMYDPMNNPTPIAASVSSSGLSSLYTTNETTAAMPAVSNSSSPREVSVLEPSLPDGFQLYHTLRIVKDAAIEPPSKSGSGD